MYSYKLSFSVLAGLMAITLFPANILASLPFGLAGPEGAVLFLNGFHFVSGHNDYEVSANHYCVIIRDDMLQCVVYNTATTPAHLAGIEYIVTEEAFETLDFEERQLWHSHQYEVTSGFLIEPGLPSVVDHTIMKDVLINTYGKTIHTWRYDQKDSLYPVGVPELVMGFTHDDQITPDFVEARDVLFGTNTTEIRDSRRDITPHDVLPGADSWKYGFSLSFGIVNTTINTGDCASPAAELIR
ncbi:hypothetical protein F5B22DRAFT_323728 [Xylaria bambusicola]|uniref:uncharacterized protein n=1 Tax=Xylaria bambusicola TaxID=326684 RepID=UPI00200827BA|nr:uncharacterized protein F5B22DRAFT_323728 [Xylaria bambusicola]KAI0509498.1 hypothetical protein F5B22DRAFT_323728 [Xylaria bambusicola]